METMPPQKKTNMQLEFWIRLTIRHVAICLAIFGIMNGRATDAAETCKGYTKQRIVELMNDLTTHDAIYYKDNVAAKISSEGFLADDLVVECFPGTGKEIKNIAVRPTKKLTFEPLQSETYFEECGLKPKGEQALESLAISRTADKSSWNVRVVFGDDKANKCSQFHSAFAKVLSNAFAALQRALITVELNADGETAKSNTQQWAKCEKEVAELLKRLNTGVAGHLTLMETPDTSARNRCSARASFEYTKFAADGLDFECAAGKWGKFKLVKASTKPDQPISFLFSGQLCEGGCGGFDRWTPTTKLVKPMRVVADLQINLTTPGKAAVTLDAYRWKDVYFYNNCGQQNGDPFAPTAESLHATFTDSVATNLIAYALNKK